MQPRTMSLVEEIPATHAHLSDLRLRVGRWLRNRNAASELTVGDVELVLSELAANVVDHTSSPWIRIAVELPGDRVAIDISNQSPAHMVPAVEEWGELLEGTRGRGLRIVRALCSAIVVMGDDTHTHVSCDIAILGDSAC